MCVHVCVTKCQKVCIESGRKGLKKVTIKKCKVKLLEWDICMFRKDAREVIIV